MKNHVRKLNGRVKATAFVYPPAEWKGTRCEYPFKKKKQNTHIEHNKVAGKIMENSPWLQMYVFFWKKKLSSQLC